MSSSPLISIGMSVRNVAATLGVALRSLQQQTLSDWELILFDDGSTDATAQVVAQFDDARIRWFADGANRGLAVRLNQAIGMARGQYFARFDGDDVCYPQRLQRQAAFLQAHPEVDLLGTGGMVFDATGQALGKRPGALDHVAICARPWSGFYLAHPTWMGRTAWFKQYGYAEQAVKAQDYDLLLRTYRSSRFACLPEILIGYREDALSLRKCGLSRWHTVLAQTRFARAQDEWGEWGAWSLAVLEQCAKAAFESVALGTGLDRRLLGHRALPIDAAMRDEWDGLWRRLNDAPPSVPPAPTFR